MKISKKAIIKYVLIFLIAGLITFGLQYMSKVTLYKLNLITEWGTSVFMLVGTLFFGLPATIGIAVGYGLSGVLIYYSLTKALMLAISEMMMGLVIYLASKRLKKLNTMREVIDLSSFCVLGCFIFFILRYYFMEIGHADVNYLYRTMNYLTSNTSCVLGIGVPLCVLIARIRNGKDFEISCNERNQIKTAMIAMPCFLAAYLTLFLSIRPNNMTSNEYWFKAFMNITVFMVLIMVVCLGLAKKKKITMIIIGAILLLFVIMGFINQDPLMAILIVIAAIIYLAVRIILFQFFEKNLETKKILKGICLALNIIFITVFIAMMALNDTISILPLENYQEEYVIVLGAPVYKGEPSDILKERLYVAERYALVNPNAIYFVSGGVKENSSGVSEAELIAQRLEQQGVNTKNIEVENQAKTTVENFENISKIFEQRGYDKEATILIISSKFHYLRVTQIAFDAGFSNLNYSYMSGNIFSNVLWSIREAIVYVHSLITG